MFSITSYLENIYADFSQYLNSEPTLCELKELTFEAGSIPDYKDIRIQQLYLLRYAFAYSFEYSEMYQEVLEQLENPDNISVTSIGCGSMIDYWSLIHALERNADLGRRVHYVGIDEVKWNYQIPARRKGEIHFLQGNVKKYFEENERFVSDVYFFPKSISEFTETEMRVMTNSLAHKPIEKDTVFLCVSIRSDKGSWERDFAKIQRIVKAFASNGFHSQDEYQYTYFPYNEGIRALDSDFIYPQEVLEAIVHLNRRCEQYLVNGENCEEDCKRLLNRNPILRTGKINYQVIKLERKMKR